MLGLGVFLVFCLLLWAQRGTDEESASIPVTPTFQKYKETRRVVRRTGVRSNPDFQRPSEATGIDSGVVEGDEEVVEPGIIMGTVVNAAGLSEGVVRVFASCVGGYIWTDADGDFFTYATSGQCVLKACRQFGVLTIWSEPVDVEVLDGEELIVQLEVPEWQPAGLGISLVEVDLGIRVAFVYPGSPAERAGIESGDIITEIDGAATVDLSVNEFAQHGIGEAGTDVDLVVNSGESERLVTVTRGLVQDRSRTDYGGVIVLQ